MDAKESDNDAARRFAGRVVELKGEIVDMIKTLKAACDRDWEDESPHY